MGDIFDAIARLAPVAAKAAEGTRLHGYRPYPAQKDFHEAGASMMYRALMGGNQCGKSEAGASEDAFHLTGNYPDWWVGKRFVEPVTGVAAGVSSELVRDSLQLKLLGPPDNFGTGLIPKAVIVGEPTRRPGVRDAVDTVRVKHRTGGTSTLMFKSYEHGEAKVQAMKLHFVHMDEEPPERFFVELVMRTTAIAGSGCCI